MDESLTQTPKRNLSPKPDGVANGPGRDRKPARKVVQSLLGMGAEILFSLGLMLIGFVISLLSGW